MEDVWSREGRYKLASQRESRESESEVGSKDGGDCDGRNDSKPFRNPDYVPGSVLRAFKWIIFNPSTPCEVELLLCPLQWMQGEVKHLVQGA